MSARPTRHDSSDLAALRGTVDAWLAGFDPESEAGRLLNRPGDERVKRGYEHTLREIFQQPVTWLETANRVRGCKPLVAATLDAGGAARGEGAVVLTGSGSSLYAGECLALPLQEALRVPVSAISAGQLLTHPQASLPPEGPYAVVSFARSGNSPESHAVVDSLLGEERVCHLILTCNGQGKLATQYGAVRRVRTVVLDEKTNDQSLVMTSSFTNLVLAGRFLGQVGEADQYEVHTRALAQVAAHVLEHDVDGLVQAARSRFTSAVYLGSGCRLGAAREASLKMLEMSGGRVSTLSESYLGLRHGPMSAIRPDTLVVAFLSSDPVVRAYEGDLIRELDRKKLGARRVIVGAGVPPELGARAEDVIVDCGTGAVLADDDLALIDVVVGQVLAFFRCLDAGLHPDSPSTEGVINRVVSGFEIHRHPS